MWPVASRGPTHMGVGALLSSGAVASVVAPADFVPRGDAKNARGGGGWWSEARGNGGADMKGLLRAAFRWRRWRGRSAGEMPDLEVLPHHVPPQGGVTARGLLEYSMYMYM